MSHKLSRRFLAPALVAVLLLASCGGSDALGDDVVSDGLGCAPTQVDRRVDDVPEIESTTEDPGEEVATEDIEAGTGCGTDTGMFLTLDLVGATADDATVFSDTFADERPITATLGSGQLIPGLETGLADMTVGGRRQLVVPAELAYGAEGNEAQGIGADEDLIFVVDLVAVTDEPLFCNDVQEIPPAEGTDKPTEVDMPVEAPQGEVNTVDLVEGEGDPVEAGNYVTLNYLGISCVSGRQFDASWDRGETFPVTLGEGTIPGFSQGIEGMKVGGRRQIEIPPALAYGAEGSPPDIAPNAPLVFIIEVVEAQDTPPSTTVPELPVDPADPGATELPGDPTDPTATTTTP